LRKFSNTFESLENFQKKFVADSRLFLVVVFHGFVQFFFGDFKKCNILQLWYFETTLSMGMDWISPS